MDAKPYVLGVDGGTTKTIALVADGQGHILGAGRSGGCNWTGPDIAAPMQVVIAAARQALAQAGLEGEDVELAVLGLAGADWPEDHTRRETYLSSVGIAARVVVKNDAFVGLRAGTRDPFGVVIVAGTGCNAAAIAPDGREWHFGHYVDDGGGGSIGRGAIQAVLRAEDGRGAPTVLTDLVLGRLGQATPEGLLRATRASEIDRSAIAGLSPLVFQAAYDGDAVATAIIVKQGTAFAEYAAALIRRFRMGRLEFDVVLSGSVFKGQGSLLIETVTQGVHQVAPRAHIVRPRFEPAVGGLLLAYDALGVNVDEGVEGKLTETMPADELFRTAEDACPTGLEEAI